MVINEMPKRTITKFWVFVIFAVCLALAASGCQRSSLDSLGNPDSAREKAPYDEPKKIGNIEYGGIDESSGLAASKCQPDVYWTHNDSGDGPFLYGLDLEGKNLGVWRVAGATNLDWEDIASFKDKNGRCFVFIGEIGNNSLKRADAAIYRVAEPLANETTGLSVRESPLETEPAESLRFVYPGRPLNAETLLVHPITGEIYVLSKSKEDPSSVFKIKPLFGIMRPQLAEKVAEIKVPAVPYGFLTGGDISPDGKRVVLCDYYAGYELILPAEAKNFDEIWSQTPRMFDAGERDTGESIAFSANGLFVIASSEKKHSPIFRMDLMTSKQ